MAATMLTGVLPCLGLYFLMCRRRMLATRHQASFYHEASRSLVRVTGTGGAAGVHPASSGFVGGVPTGVYACMHMLCVCVCIYNLYTCINLNCWVCLLNP